MLVASLCGSDRAGSTNAVVAAAIADLLAARDVDVRAVDTSVDTATFRPDSVDDPPTDVADARALFEAADGAVFVVPEYAGGPPGWVKNLTDWMVGSGSLYERPSIVVSAATGGGRHAIAGLARTLTWQGAFVVGTCGVAGPATRIADGRITDPKLSDDLDHSVARLVDAIEGGRERAVELAVAAVGPLGIDVHDRTT